MRRTMLAVLAASVAAGIHGLLPGLVARAVVYDLASLAVVVMVGLQLQRSPRDRQPWWLVTTVGFALLLVGNVTWDVVLDGGTDPTGGLADWMFLVGYALTSVGLLGVAAGYLRGGWLEIGLEAVAAGALLGALVWVWIDSATAAGPGRGQVIATMLVVFSTTRTLALVRVAATHRRSWRLAAASLGLLVWLVADIAYAGPLVTGTYKTGGWLDAVWLAATILLVIGLSGRLTPCSNGCEPLLAGDHVVLGRRIALGLTVGLAPMFVLLSSRADWHGRAALAAAAVVVGAAVVVRVELLNTRHEQARRQRDEMTSRYEQLFEGTASPMLLVDHGGGGRIVDANPAAADLYGYDRAALRSMSIHDINPMSPEEITAAMARAHRSPRAPFEFRHRLASGQVIPVDIYSGPVPFGGRQVLFSIVHDASARHEAMDAARDSEHRWQQLAALAEDVVYRATYRDGTLASVDYVNPAGLTVLGVAPSTLMADPSQVGEHLHRDDRDRFLHLDQRHADGATNETFRWQRPDGQMVWLEDRRTQAEEDGGAITVVGVVRDVTTQHRTEQALRSAVRQQQEVAEELRRVDQMKTLFLQATSHELRTPLTSLVGFLATLREHGDVLDVEQRDLFLARADANAHRLQRLLENLLDLNRLSHGLTIAKRQQADLGQLLQEIVATTDLRDHDVHLHVEDGLIVGDTVLLARALENLLDNALRHTPAGTQVHIHVTRDHVGLAVTVEDDGPGLPTEFIGDAFEPFSQGPQAQSDPNPGVGIGLALTAQIAALHGGTLTAENRPDGGARFTLVLRDTPKSGITDGLEVRGAGVDQLAVRTS